MAGLFDKQAEVYLEARPTYPKEWYMKLAALTPQHSLAWDVGTGNGQAAYSLSEHYQQVVGSDISEEQLKHAMQHPRVRYIHTPTSISEDEMINLIAGGHENSVDLITVAEAIHWFDLPQFYSLVRRLLRKAGGVIAVWGYNHTVVSPDFDLLMKPLHEKMLPYYDPKTSYLWEGYRTLPFPFESVGLGREGEPMELDIKREQSFQGLVRFMRSCSAVTTAKDQGVDLHTRTQEFPFALSHSSGCVAALVRAYGHAGVRWSRLDENLITVQWVYSRFGGLIGGAVFVYVLSNTGLLLLRWMWHGRLTDWGLECCSFGGTPHGSWWMVQCRWFDGVARRRVWKAGGSPNHVVDLDSVPDLFV